MQYCLAIERVTSQPVYRFRRVGDNATCCQLSHGFTDVPVHDEEWRADFPLLQYKGYSSAFSMVGRGASHGSANLQSCCGHTRWVPERLVVLIEVIGQ